MKSQEWSETIHLDRGAETPLHRQLFEALVSLMHDAVILPGARLPSVRALSAALGVNPVTVVNAYRTLCEKGYAEARTGSGTYVSEGPSAVSGQKVPELADEIYDGEDYSFLVPGKPDEKVWNFASATPPAEMFPVEAFRNAIDHVMERDRGNAFSYQEGQGYGPLRTAVSAQLSARGIPSAADRIHVISGAQQGIDIVAKALLREGDTVLVESPTYTGAVAVFKSRGVRILEVPAGPEGADLQALAYLARTERPKLFYTIPSFQNPSGASMPETGRRQLLELAQQYQFFILEDDYVSDLNYDHLPLPPVAALDTHGRTVFVRSFSKILMPGLRLGFLLAPEGLAGRIAAAKHATDIATPALFQRAFEYYLAGPDWKKHLETVTGLYESRYHAVCEALDRHLPSSVQYKKPGGGLNIWIELPYGYNSMKISRQLAQENVLVAPGSMFFPGSDKKPNCLRLSFVTMDASEMDEGIRRICSRIWPESVSNRAFSLF